MALSSNHGSFPTRVAELERALEQAETKLRGPELERARALVAALMDVHRATFEDLERVVGKEELTRIAEQEPSIAWALACHGIASAPLEGSVAEAEARTEAKERSARPKEPVLLPAERLVRREREPAA
jgi:hypothetical protein